jgi:hypothetical protein
MANGLFNLKQVVQAVQQGGWPAQKPPAVEYLVVAGGGGAGNGNGATSNGGGGGGAGGLLQGIDPVPNGQTLLVTVGGGGAGGATNSNGVNGSNSIFSAITSLGGGFGAASRAGNAGNGGSGGGAGESNNVSSGGTAGQGTKGQGNAGGIGVSYPCGGGGGAGTIGGLSAAISTPGGDGGSGISSAISGTVTAYAGGGGGCAYNGGGSTAGRGGAGGGGAANVSGTGTSGTANTGGGGGGSGNTGSSGGTGGSGIVIVSYPDVYAAAASTTGSPTVSTSGSGSAYFTGAGGVNGPYLEYPYSSSMQFGSGDFTLECWCYFNAVQESTILARFPFDGSSNEWAFTTSSSLIPYFFYSVTGGNSATSFIGVNQFALSTWYHFAVVRSGTVLTMYINGTSVAAQSIAGSIYSSGTPTTTFGSYAKTGVGPNGYAVPNGYLSNVRVVKGTAVYTSNFTPNTTPLTAISGTSMLFNTVSGAYTADSSSNSFTPSAPSSFGPPTWNQLSPFSTGLGYKNRVYSFASSGSITF